MIVTFWVIELSNDEGFECCLSGIHLWLYILWIIYWLFLRIKNYYSFYCMGDICDVTVIRLNLTQKKSQTQTTAWVTCIRKFYFVANRQYQTHSTRQQPGTLMDLYLSPENYSIILGFWEKINYSIQKVKNFPPSKNFYLRRLTVLITDSSQIQIFLKILI